MTMSQGVGSSLKVLWSSILTFMLTMEASSIEEEALLNPPIGNYPILKVVGRGAQVYKCQEEGDGFLQYELLHAEADLYDYKEKEKEELIIGHHYFLPRPDAGGGKPTWSLHSNLTQAPLSTVTCKVIASVPSQNNRRLNIPSLLLRATSHSGHGFLSHASYVQRLHSIGGAAPCCCYEEGAILRVPYKAEYIIWAQITSPTKIALSIPPMIWVPPSHVPLISYFGEGVQIYRFNGSSWVLHNVSAALSSIPGGCVSGQHYFLAAKDAKGGQASWEVFEPACRVTAKTVEKASVDSSSIPWLLNVATSHSGLTYSSPLGLVSYVQRMCTSRGNPPSSTTRAKVGDLFESPYTSIYFFYVPFYYGSSH